jgi:hypothetical protein
LCFGYACNAPSWYISPTPLLLLESSFEIHSCLCIGNEDMKSCSVLSRHYLLCAIDLNNKITFAIPIATITVSRTATSGSIHNQSIDSWNFTEHLHEKMRASNLWNKITLQIFVRSYGIQLNFQVSIQVFITFYTTTPTITNTVNQLVCKSFHITQCGKLLRESRTVRRNHNIR